MKFSGFSFSKRSLLFERGGSQMRIYRAKDYYDMSRKAANIISAQVIMKPDCVLGLATGSTPVGTYAQLVEWYKKGGSGFFRGKDGESG